MRSKSCARPALFHPLCSRFKTLMTNKSEQDGDGGKTIEISDMKYHIFQMMMQYLYHGGAEAMDIPATDVLELLSAASLFQLDALQRHCEILCSQTLSVESAVNTYKYAKVSAMAACCLPRAQLHRGLGPRLPSCAGAVPKGCGRSGGGCDALWSPGSPLFSRAACSSGGELPRLGGLGQRAELLRVRSLP
uniref:BTB domain-containing protein n=1 Tax=Ursus americanus TaxID=9643 RepID=A0A452R638_URSAM